MFKEFREFIARGSVIDLAVGIVIGAAFGSIVTSFVEDILMPPVGLLLGKADFSNLFINLSGQEFESLAAARDAGAAVIAYGAFLNNIITFIIIAFAVFLVVRAVNRMRRADEAPPPNTRECPFCITDIPLAATRCPNCTSDVSVVP